MLIKIIKKIKWDRKADRIGPDIPFTHWRLFFPKMMDSLCQTKFKKFSTTAQFRPGAYAVGCSKIEIGNRVVVRPGSMFFGESESLDTSICIEDDVMMGCGVHIYINNHKFDKTDIPLIDQGYYPDSSVILRRGCWIGANAILLPGVEVGENAVVGAGSIVTRSVPKGIVVAGNPAKQIKAINAI